MMPNGLGGSTSFLVVHLCQNPNAGLMVLVGVPGPMRQFIDFEMEAKTERY